jgi:hypothetical protein
MHERRCFALDKEILFIMISRWPAEQLEELEPDLDYTCLA